MSGARLSRRLPDVLTPNPLAIRLDERRRRGEPVLDLTGSNPTRLGFEPTAEVLEALAHPGALIYAPDPRGLPAARAAVSGYYAARGAAVDPERIVLTAGTSEGYSFLFKLLGDAGSTVVTPRPSYPLVSHLAELEGWEVEGYPLRLEGDRWRVDLRALGRVLERARDPRALVVIHPNNPTGSDVDAAEAAGIVALCRERNLPLIVDEVFLDYPLEARPGEPATWAGDRARDAGDLPVFVLSGLSKVAALPQVKLSWIVARADSRVRDRLDHIADAYLSVGGPVQWGAERLLAAAGERRLAIQARLDDNLGRLRRWGSRVPQVEIPRVSGGWSAIIRTPGGMGDDEFALALLDRDGVHVHPGYLYDFDEEGFLVVSLLVPPDTLERGLAAIAGHLAAGSAPPAADETVNPNPTEA